MLSESINIVDISPPVNLLENGQNAATILRFQYYTLWIIYHVKALRISKTFSD